MKKLISLLLALAMILALSTTAFAAENTSLTITNSEGRTYNGYKLLNLTTSLKCSENHTHTDSCYNYAYTVNEKYAAILQAQAGEADIIEFLSGLTSDNGTTYGTLREVADSIYRAILDAKLAPDAENLKGTGSIIGQGYWLFADVTDLSEDEAANSLVMVDTKGQDALTINPKLGLPTVEKKVQDVNDTTGDTTNWQDSADYDIGDTVPFQLTATLPANVANYDSYMISFHDTLSAGLTLDVSSITVTVDGKTTTAFTYAAGENGAFTLTCDNVLAIEGVTKDSKIVVTYNATLNDQAAIGAAGNPNEVYLEFSNNPYGTGTGKTEKDKVIVFTYQVIVNKTDSSNNPLQGAGFTLYKKNAKGTYVTVGNAQAGSGDNGNIFTWTGLDDGEYKLVETTVPDGYNKMADIEFTITAEHSETADEPELISLTSTFGTVKGGTIKETVINQTGAILPETGAQGTLMIIAFSSMLVMAAVVFMVTRKKMSIYED